MGLRLLHLLCVWVASNNNEFNKSLKKIHQAYVQYFKERVICILILKLLLSRISSLFHLRFSIVTWQSQNNMLLLAVRFERSPAVVPRYSNQALSLCFAAAEETFCEGPCCQLIESRFWSWIASNVVIPCSFYILKIIHCYLMVSKLRGLRR